MLGVHSSKDCFQPKSLSLRSLGSILGNFLLNLGQFQTERIDMWMEREKDKVLHITGNEQSSVWVVAEKF